MSSSSKFLALQTCDGKEFVLDEVIAVRSQTIKNMVEDDCVSNVIPLPNVDSKTMTKVLEYWKKHSEEGVSKDMLIYFDKAFVNVHHSILYDFILAANFLNDKEILDIICQEVANRIKGKTPEEIRMNLISRMILLQRKKRRFVKRMLGLLNDFITLELFLIFCSFYFYFRIRTG
ncbi:hypothetical protein AABB24_020381 [Solanum stoloniferum]|uniref:SKP1-like protein n=1 Tax=Solanum stoloniferum TaxID=62892 RepID=A0ABD2T7W4_9SOLN